MNVPLSIWAMSKQDSKLMAISDLIYMNKRRSSSDLDKGILISKRWYCSVWWEMNEYTTTYLDLDLHYVWPISTFLSRKIIHWLYVMPQYLLLSSRYCQAHVFEGRLFLCKGGLISYLFFVTFAQIPKNRGCKSRPWASVINVIYAHYWRLKVYSVLLD